MLNCYIMQCVQKEPLAGLDILTDPLKE